MPAIKAFTFPVNNVGDREAVVIAEPRCYLVEIRELPSVDEKQLYYVSDVPSGGERYEVHAGTPFFFPAPKRGFFAGERAGYVESSTGATTFQRLEHLLEPW